MGRPHSLISTDLLECQPRVAYGRTVAVCWAGDTDLNAWMTAQGWAWAYSSIFTRLRHRRATSIQGKARGLAGRLHLCMGLAPRFKADGQKPRRCQFRPVQHKREHQTSGASTSTTCPAGPTTTELL